MAKNGPEHPGTPAQLGYRYPAEWEPHDAVFLSWPHDNESFPELEPVEMTYCEMIRALQSTNSDKVKLFVTDGVMRSRVVRLLERYDCDPGGVEFFVHDYGDVWFRDYGPIFLTKTAETSGAASDDARLAMVRWGFNAWGGKYPELFKDARIPAMINEKMRLRSFEPGIVMEGGSLEVNGEGSLLTTEQCLLNQNRNPGITKQEIEQHLKEYLNITTVIWLKNGIAGDDTDGHIDNLARFVSPTTILCAYEEDKNDDNHDPLKENYETLSKVRDQDGRPFTVIRLPMPRLFIGSRRLPASYANFYIANNAVLVPTYGHENDPSALSIIQAHFPTRKVIGIGCRALVNGFGAIHCVTQQQPSVS